MSIDVIDVGLSYYKNTPKSDPLYVGINEPSDHGSLVIDTTQNIDLLKQRKGDINQPTLPDIYKQLKSKKAKEEFKTFWKLVQSIQSNLKAHEHKNFKRFITTVPLKLNNLLSEVKDKNIDFQLDTFLFKFSITLERSLLTSAELNDAELNDAELNDAELNDAELNDAKLNRAKLNRAELNDAELNRAELNGAWLIDAELNDAELNDAELNDAELNDAELNDAELNRAELNGAKLNGAWLIDAELNDAKLNRAELNHAWLIAAKLNDAELNDAELNDAELNRAELNDAKLNDAKLNDAKLTGAELTGAKLTGIELNNGTKFDEKTQLKEIKCKSINFRYENGTVTEIKDKEQIRQKFIELGAQDMNISFAQAA